MLVESRVRREVQARFGGEFLETYRRNTARRRVLSLRLTAQYLVLFGREYKELGEKVYGFKVNKHIVFYRIPDDGAIEVVRILHERMDLSNRFVD